MDETKVKFRGFHGITDKGTPCWVRLSGALKDGTPAYKVTLGEFVGYAGDHTVRHIATYNGKTGWLSKDKVTRR